MYIYIYISLYIYVCKYIYTYIYIYIYICIYKYTCMYISRARPCHGKHSLVPLCPLRLNNNVSPSFS